MSDPKQRHVIGDLRGGRNGYDPEWAIKDTECVDAVNVDYYKSRFGRKRGGMIDPTLTSGFAGVVSSLFRHVPSTSEAAAELWGVDDSATPVIKRVAAGTAWSTPTLKDAPTGNGWDVSAASINGKLFLAYQSAQKRLHCWDGSTVRRAGLAGPAVPTVANTGAGTYAAVLRYYRVRWTVQASGITVRRSEPSSYATFTPSGAGTAARVTQPAVANEGETHWEVEASVDSLSFYRIATVVIGTATYDDSAATTTYSTTGTLSDLTGRYTVQKSYKFIAADQNRLLGFGDNDATGKQNRIEVSAVIGSSDIGDDERVDTNLVNSYVDLDENDSGVPTGLRGPILGSYFAFKDRQTWQLTATGNTASPYRQDPLSKSIGAVANTAIVIGEDQFGNAALYWMSHRGPYRWSINGLEYLGRPVEDYVLGPTATINLSATKRVAVTLYHQDKRQVWYWWATGSSNDPNVGLIYDVMTGGWTRIPSSDLWANVRCACLFANTIGASMSRDLKPYVGQTGAANRAWKADSGTDDAGTAFKAYVLTKAYEPGGAGYRGAVGDALLLAQAATGVTITDLVIPDYDATRAKTGTAILTPTGSETRVTRRVEASAFAEDISFVQHQIGDAAAVSNAWNLDRLMVPFGRNAAAAA